MAEEVRVAGKPFRARSNVSVKAEVDGRELTFRPVSAIQAMRLAPVVGPILRLVDAAQGKGDLATAAAALVEALCAKPQLAGAIVLDALRDMELEESNPGKPADVDGLLAGVDGVVLAELLAAVVAVNIRGSLELVRGLPALLEQAHDAAGTA
jgi:hypothetical protein